MNTKKLERLIKKSPIIQRLYIFFGSLFFSFVGLFVRTKQNRVLFSSFSGKQFSDSPKIIYEKMQERYGDKLEYIWALDHPDRFPELTCQKVRMNSLKYFLVALSSKYWVTNVNIEKGMRFKKRATRYLNTWHGVCLDFIGNDRPKRKDYDFRKIQFMTICGSFEECSFASAFRIGDSQMLKVGLPRNDRLLSGNLDVRSLKEELGIPLNKKIILYAPTWRENSDLKTNDSFLIPLDISRWKELFAKKYVLLFRAHSITKNLTNASFDDFFINVSAFPDTNKLLSAVDILITDYSSILFDFSLLERPIFNFGYDYEEYCLSHGFYVDYASEMPNGIIRKEDDLIDAIANIDLDLQREKTIALKEKYMNYSLPNSTDLCVDALLGESVIL